MRSVPCLIKLAMRKGTSDRVGEGEQTWTQPISVDTSKS